MGLELNVPGKEFVDPIDRMVSDPLKHVRKIRLGIQVVEFCRSQKAIHRGGALATGVRTEEEIIFPADPNHSQRTFRDIMPCSGLCRLELASRHSCSRYTDRLAA